MRTLTLRNVSIEILLLSKPLWVTKINFSINLTITISVKTLRNGNFIVHNDTTL